MTSERLITLAIHTFDRASEVKTILEHEGIYTELNNVNLSNPQVSAGVRVRIKESDLPKALLIVENFEIFQGSEKHPDQHSRILVPTDFSTRSMLAAKIAMNIASKMKSEIEFLHAYITPTNRDALQLSDTYDYESNDTELSGRIRTEAESQMARFIASIKTEIKNGKLPPVKFTTRIDEGIPEEAILNYTRRYNPALVVMTTREAQKKESDLIGSVSAEVLDGCRVPAFTVPETIDSKLLANITHTVFLCNLDQEDILALDSLHRMLPSARMHVTLLNVPPRRLRNAPQPEAAAHLLQYCRTNYPGYTFSAETVSTHAVADHLHQKSEQHPFQMLCIPNKHKNVVSRIFNPSLAHKLLFRTDIPMMVLPV